MLYLYSDLLHSFDGDLLFHKLEPNHLRDLVANSAQLLTILKVNCFADVYADQCHQLQLRQSLTSGGRQRQQFPKLADLVIDQVPPQFGGAFRGLASVETAGRTEWK